MICTDAFYQLFARPDTVPAIEELYERGVSEYLVSYSAFISDFL